MLRFAIKTAGVIALVLGLGAVAGSAQNMVPSNDQDQNYYADRPAIDRYLSTEVWTDHSDAEYYSGDNVSVYFRTNSDAFVAIYSIDSRGMVDLLFPAREGDDNFVRGGITYSLPGPDDDYDLILSGPSGDENIQILASREQFPIPMWYHNSGIVCDWDNRNDYMDYLNGKYFVRYDGQRFAYDRAVLFINEWEPDYFRPVYYPEYPSWSVCGNAYVDYPWGSSIYINGVYWGCAPLYIPRLLVGWHTITVIDPWGYCWEDDFHCSRYNTVIFDKTIIRTGPSVVSKYKEVRAAGYRDPVKAGYPKFNEEVQTWKKARSGDKVMAKTTIDPTVPKRVQSEGIAKADFDSFTPPAKKYTRGEVGLVKSDRGYESRGIIDSDKNVVTSKQTRSTAGKSVYDKSSSGSGTTQGNSGVIDKSTRTSGTSGTYDKSTSGSGSSSSSGDYYRKKTGSTDSRGSSNTSGNTTKKQTIEKKKTESGNSGNSSKSGSVKSSPSSKSSGNSSGTVKSKPSSGGGGQQKSSGSSTSSSSSSSRSKRSR